QGKPMREVRASGVRRVAEVGEVRPGLIEMTGHPPANGEQRGGLGRGEGQPPQTRRRLPIARGLRRLLEDHVRVGAAESEGTDARPSRPVPWLEGSVRGRYGER